MTRGLVIALTPNQRTLRARMMANHPGAPWFDRNLPIAPEGYYRLIYPNGGTDPTAPDNFAHWRRHKKSDGTDEIISVPPEDDAFHFVTGDCVSLIAWASGFDRLQKERGGYLQGGAINCDYMRADAIGKAMCFRRLDRPQIGAIVVYGSLPDADHDGSRDGAGHTGLVVSVPAEWDPAVKDCWDKLGVIDCASRTPHLAVQLTTGRAWFGSRVDHAGHTIPKNSFFVESIMTP